ncbi:MAG: translation initiation factor IF-2 [Chloroflexi bacterium]|nr:translation initiation factor IF-2 [Chloroflexota bacterium]
MANATSAVDDMDTVSRKADSDTGGAGTEPLDKARPKKTAPKKTTDKTPSRPHAAGEAGAEKTVARPAAPAAPAKPSAPARPSMYTDISATAKKLETERVAKAALRATQTSQAPAPSVKPAPTKPASSNPFTPKRPAPTFITSPITAPSVRKPEPPKEPPASAQPAAKPATPAAAAQQPPAAEPAATPPISVESKPFATAARAVEPPASRPEPVSAPEIMPTKPHAPTPARPATAGKLTAPSRSARTAGPISPRTEAAHTRPAQQFVPAKTTTPHPPAPKPAPSAPPKARPTQPPAAPGVPHAGRQVEVKAKPATQPAQPERVAAKTMAVPVEAMVVKSAAPPPPPPQPALAEIPAIIGVRDLAPLLKTTAGDMIKKLLQLGIFATINQSLDYETASLIAEEFHVKTKPAPVTQPKEEPPQRPPVEETARLQPRPPVVTVLGHVDHGKTSLLDAIRNAKVAAGEAGGITQHIGAYQVEKQGRKITFLDTPGHEAFTAMRARGAQATDVAVLVVAADDGVMPQTKEAISHARAAKVPIVVALNKMDRETADPPKVMRQLSDAGLIVEEWGGDVPLVRVSAKKMTGIDELLEIILLVSDLAELKANPDRTGAGTVIEAEMDRSRGPIATLLVQNGTLRQGDNLVISDIQGRIRAMFNDRGERLIAAGPSTPVVVLGLPSVPRAGDTFEVVADERAARTMAGLAAAGAQEQAMLKGVKAISLDEIYAQMQAGKVHDLNLVLKADVQGSLEPIHNSLEKLSTETLKVRLIHEGTGFISESDVNLALASGAIVIGFNVEPDSAAKRVAASEGVDVRRYSIIYKLIEDVEKALSGLLEPTYKEVISGRVDVRQVFKVSKKTVAGCYVTEGKATRAGQARLMRGGKPVYDGRIASLKRFTEDVREVNTGFECGVMLEGWEDVKLGDKIEFYHKEKEA